MWLGLTLHCIGKVGAKAQVKTPVAATVAVLALGILGTLHKSICFCNCSICHVVQGGQNE
jgi:hypothetical protein